MESYQRLKEALKGRIVFGEPLYKHTTFCIGGPADIWAEPENEADLKRIVLFAKKNRVKIFPIGSGSNILADDKGFKGLVMSLSSPGFTNVSVSGRTIRAGAGAKLAGVVCAAYRHALAGMEGLAGIPGTVGGAVFMNSGHISSTGRNLSGVKVMDRNGNIFALKPGDLKFGYRKSNLSCYIILEAEFSLKRGIKKVLKREHQRLIRLRKKSQPLNKKSAGCVFKNPKNLRSSAANLIENCGLKGHVFGGAKISKKHANFIINNRAANSGDVSYLISLVRKNVKEKFNISLKPEIIRLGIGMKFQNHVPLKITHQSYRRRRFS